MLSLSKRFVAIFMIAAMVFSLTVLDIAFFAEETDGSQNPLSTDPVDVEPEQESDIVFFDVESSSEIENDPVVDDTSSSSEIDGIGDVPSSEMGDMMVTYSVPTAGEGMPGLAIQNGSRLISTVENGTYIWQKWDPVAGEYVDIPDAIFRYYDLTPADSGAYIRVIVNGTSSAPIGPIGKVVVFDLAKGVVYLAANYSGKDPDGVAISGTHDPSNVYIVKQSNNSVITTNNIAFAGHWPDRPYDLTLDGVNMGQSSYSTCAPNTSTLGSYSSGTIQVTAPLETQKNVIIRLKGENIVKSIYYYTGNSVRTTGSALKITDINGDGATDGGTLYMPIKVDPANIDEFVKRKTNYNHWNAAIGGDDSYQDVVNLTIAGGNLQILSTYGDNCTSIGGGGNGYCRMSITGGNIVAHCNGTGTAIGGGIGWYSAGGSADITITGGNVYAKNHSEIYIKNGGITSVKDGCDEMVGGVAIGGGSSFHKEGSTGTVTITGGHVEAYGTFGNGMGGGNSSISTGGKATINIGDGTVVANSIGGGNSKSGAGGSATVNVSGTADVTITTGIGGGDSSSGVGGEATITITGGELYCSGVIGGGNGGDTGDGGAATITVENGVLTSESIGGGTGGATGNGGSATIIVKSGTLACSGGIGGGVGNSTGNGGAAIINVSGGELTSASIGGGVGGLLGNGGSADITISGGTIETGSIGGGSTLNPSGNLGYAKANISGGDISGQFIMAAAGDDHCSFIMTDGKLHGVNTLESEKYTYVQANGAAVYMNDPHGIAILSGGSIENCTAENGGAVYMTDGQFTLSGDGRIIGCSANTLGGAIFLGGGTLSIEGGSIEGASAENGGAVYMTQGQFSMSGTGRIEGCSAERIGGGVYLGGGALTVDGGQIINNSAVDGGGVYLANGNMFINGGEIAGNDALGSGGGALVNGGNVTISGGGVKDNTAVSNGGGIAVNNGNYIMYGGEVSGNASVMGSGGGIYVSADGSDVKVDILSGSISSNHANVDGGAVAVVGRIDGFERVDVTVGVNEKHFDSNGNAIMCDHGAVGVYDCPIIAKNTAQESGGAIYVSGNNETTQLSLFCLDETGSFAGGDDGQSDFMKVEGGKVIISTADMSGSVIEGSENGNIVIENTIYVTGGQMDMWGSTSNPRVSGIITVDITKLGDYFIDHRDPIKYYRLIYFENFTDPATGITTGQYKEVEVPVNTEITISGNIYNHPGYSIEGWNTHPKKGHDFGVGTNPNAPDLGWYEVGGVYTVDGTIIKDIYIYAIWDAHGYNVIFDPNVTSYTGEMDVQVLIYDTPDKLAKNTFGYAGHSFVEWNTKPDGSGDSYGDEEIVTNLTTERGVVVTLYAQWEPCNHDPDTHNYTYTVEDNGATLKRTCSCITYSETATVISNSNIYDMEPNPADIRYSSSWRPEITYWEGDVQLDSAPVNAGEYLVCITEADVTAASIYTINKAEQPAPQKPVLYDPGVNIMIKTIADSPLKSIDSSYDSTKQYKIVYYVGSEKRETEWRDGIYIDGVYEAKFEFDVALTNYYIYARYSEGSNYLASPQTAAETSYFYPGNIVIDVEKDDTVQEPIIFVADGTDDEINGITVIVNPASGYYFPEDYTITVTTTSDTDEVATMTKTSGDNNSGEYQITDIPKNCRILITIPSAKKATTVSAFIDGGEIFSALSSVSATISRDSAYTAYFKIGNYDEEIYSGLNLTFEPTLPAGTTIIFKDIGTNGYFYKCLDADTDSIDVESFFRMGGNATDKFTPYNGDMDLLFTVDFSGTMDGAYGNEIITSLIPVKATTDPVPEAYGRSTVALTNGASFDMAVSGTRLEHLISYTYNKATGESSVYDNRYTAMVISPRTEMPSEAHIIYASGGFTSTAYANSEGKFIIPLWALESGDVSLTLVSNLFPDVATVYEADVEWILSETVVSAAPMNSNDILCSGEVIFTSSNASDPSVKISCDKRLYLVFDTVEALINWNNISPGSEVIATLMRKSDDGKYSSTGLEFDIDTSVATFISLNVSLAGQKAGSYCLQVTVMSGLVKVAETYYYFIVE